MADMRETCANYVQGEPTATIYTSERKWVTRLTALAEQYPTDVHIERMDDGVTVRAVMPPDWVFKFRPPRKMSAESRVRAAERLRAYQQSRNDREKQTLPSEGI